MNTLEEMLRRSDQLGISAIALTDHGPATDNSIQTAQNRDEPYKWYKRIKGPDEHYFKVLVTRYQPPEEIKTRLFKGIECNILGEGRSVVDIPWTLVTKFDVVIASVHPIPYLFEVRDQNHVTERLLMALDQPIDIIGHPFHKNFESDQKLIVKSAAEKEIALEVNNSSLRLKKAHDATILQMLEFAKKYDCKISLSSDSHAANELGSDECIRPLLQQAEFPVELIVNHSLEAACNFIENRKKIREERKAQIKK
jgi:putative hydrolase